MNFFILIRYDLQSTREFLRLLHLLFRRWWVYLLHVAFLPLLLLGDGGGRRVWMCNAIGIILAGLRRLLLGGLFLRSGSLWRFVGITTMLQNYTFMMNNSQKQLKIREYVGAAGFSSSRSTAFNASMIFCSSERRIVGATSV